MEERGIRYKQITYGGYCYEAIKHFFLCFFFLSWVGTALGDERCPLTGYTYTLVIEDARFELSGFECTFGPGCEATADLWYGNFEIGPKYYMSLPFVCEAIGDILIGGLPCTLDTQGNLKCLCVNATGYSCTRLGTKIWCLPEKPDEFQMKSD